MSRSEQKFLRVAVIAPADMDGRRYRAAVCMALKGEDVPEDYKNLYSHFHGKDDLNLSGKRGDTRLSFISLSKTLTTIVKKSPYHFYGKGFRMLDYERDDFFDLLVIVCDPTDSESCEFTAEVKTQLTEHPCPKWVVFTKCELQDKWQLDRKAQQALAESLGSTSRFVFSFSVDIGLYTKECRSQTQTFISQEINYLHRKKTTSPLTIEFEDSIAASEVALAASKAAHKQFRAEYSTQVASYIRSRKVRAGCSSRAGDQLDIHDDTANEQDALRGSRPGGILSISGYQKVLAARSFLNFLDNPSSDNLIALKSHLKPLNQGRSETGLARIFKAYIREEADSMNLVRRCCQSESSAWVEAKEQQLSSFRP